MEKTSGIRRLKMVIYFVNIFVKNNMTVRPMVFMVNY